MQGVSACFQDIEDPRAGNVRHRLCDLLVIMLAASACGAATATDFALFAEQRRAALSRVISYDKAPSHDTFSRLLRLLKPDALTPVLTRLAAAFARAVGGEGGPDVVALDGKALRRAYERGNRHSPPLTVSAFAARTRLCLSAYAPGAQENEIEAALKVVELLDLAGRLVTADALHCHHRMAEALHAQRADYLLPVKGNRRHWLKAARAAFEADAAPDLRHVTQAHDRRESRDVWVRHADAPLAAGHAAFVKLVSRRDEATPVTRYFLASKAFSPAQALDAARAHWRIENNLHWTLDVHLREDEARLRKDHAPANLALLLRAARNLLQRCDNSTIPIGHRIKKCAWNDDYLIKAIAHMR